MHPKYALIELVETPEYIEPHLILLTNDRGTCMIHLVNAQLTNKKILMYHLEEQNTLTEELKTIKIL